jgi:hypothetical protein
MKVYISGKITGLPIQDAEIKFQAAQDLLESLDFEVVNPLKNGLKKDSSWKEHMVKDIDLILTCDVIYMIDGWTDSVGACIEYDIAVRTGKKILFESEVIKNLNLITKTKDAIHEVTGLTFNEYSSKSRKRDGFYARMLFAHECSENGIKISTISELIQRDRTTVLYTLNKYYDEVKYNPEFRRLAESFSEIIKEENE